MLMCGRFTLTDPERLASRYPRLRFPKGIERSYNVAPTHAVVGLCSDRASECDFLEWGFVDTVRGQSPAQRTINARSETVAEKRMFRTAFRERRCIVFADGYYEWRTDGKRKRPFYFTLDGETPFAFAGIWNPGYDPQRRVCCLMTTRPNSIQARVHDRAPVILLDDADIEVWLTQTHEEVLRSLLEPMPDMRITTREVHYRVGNVQNNDASCLAPALSHEMTLF